jgi:PEP-CTERM motif
MMKLALVAGAALLGASLAGSAPAMAGGSQSCVEDNVSGCVVGLTNFENLYIFASDGESPFNPFGWSGDQYNPTGDTSDGLQTDISNPWQQVGNGWTQIAQNQWILPAVTPNCGSENEPRCEPIGHWIDPGFVWVIPTPWNVYMWESDGSYSDRIVLDNNGPGGIAEIWFASDPNAIPEPSTWAMMLLGFAGLGFAGYRARKQTAALAA